jgi:hypothetical protein
MKILDQRHGVIDDAATLAPIRKALGRDPNWQTIAKLRDTPELAKRFKKRNAGTITDLANPTSRNDTVLHARLHSLDESKHTFYADMDQASGLSNYKQTKRAFKDLPAYFHGPGDKGRPVGDLDWDCDDSRQRIRLKGTCDDEDEWDKVSDGVYAHLRIEHDMDGMHVSLTDSKASEPAKYLKLAKRDGSTSTVLVKPQGAYAVGSLAKSDCSLDPFKKALAKASGRFGR